MPFISAPLYPRPGIVIYMSISADLANEGIAAALFFILQLKLAALKAHPQPARRQTTPITNMWDLFRYFAAALNLPTFKNEDRTMVATLFSASKGSGLRSCYWLLPGLWPVIKRERGRTSEFRPSEQPTAARLCQ